MTDTGATVSAAMPASTAPWTTGSLHMPTVAVTQRLKAFDLSLERCPDAGGGLSDSDARWPGRMRRIVRASLNYWRQGDLADTAELLTSELVTNALCHGAGQDVGMRLSLTQHSLLIEVRDGSPQRPVLRDAQPDDENGRGLALVDALADAWGISADGTRTWFSLSLREGI
ncbi:ATP-binding protein [Streptomyces seoulensis]